MSKRYNFLNCTLLSCFLVYAISPLSYACTSPAAAAYPRGQEDSGFRNFSIYFFEAVLKGFFPPEDDETAPADGPILVIKKYALVRFSPEMRQKLVKSAAALTSAVEIPQSWSAEPARADAGVYKSTEVPSYSGLSPPRPLPFPDAAFTSQ